MPIVEFLKETYFCYLSLNQVQPNYNIRGYNIIMTGFEKTWLPHTFRNILFNYLKYCNWERKTGACMKFATIL